MLNKRMKAAALTDIKIDDSFWNKHITLVPRETIPYQWDAINDRIADAESSHCLENFKIAAGEAEGEFYGAVFQDTDIAKWLEAVAFSLAAFPDPELEQRADEVIELLGRAQQEDGYLNTYYTIAEPGRRWTNLMEGHELYTAGHLIEAAVAYYQCTGKRTFLDIMMRFADLICAVFGEGENQLHGYPGHQEIELALIKLYYATGQKQYLETAWYFINARGVGENYFLQEIDRHDHQYLFPEFAGYSPIYSQSHLPVRAQETADGHAVRAVYMYSAMAELAYEYKDQKLLAACRKLWNNIVQKRMYITGSIGSSGILERFTTDYDLPNDRNYSESCASVGLMMFGLRMNQVTGEARYMDVVERALYNTVLSGIALDGKSFFYVNPLEVWPDNCLDKTSLEHVKPIRQKWFGVACCPTNIARTLASVGQYIYSADEERICVNLFVSNETELQVDGDVYHLELETKFPYENSFEMRVSGLEKGLEIRLRIPDYADNYEIMCEGEVVTYEKKDGYAVCLSDYLNRRLSVSFDAPAVFMRANPKVRADAGKVCIMKGPLVYALEEADNGKNLSALYVDTNKPLLERFDEQLFGGTVIVQAEGYRISEEEWQAGELYARHLVKPVPVRLKAVPYAYWNNRGAGEMLVWIKELISGRS